VVRQEIFRPRPRLHERLDLTRAFVRFGSCYRGCVDNVVTSTTAKAHQERILLSRTRYVTSVAARPEEFGADVENDRRYTPGFVRPRSVALLLVPTYTSAIASRFGPVDDRRATLPPAGGRS